MILWCTLLLVQSSLLAFDVVKRTWPSRSQDNPDLAHLIPTDMAQVGQGRQAQMV